ncbi:MAG TPA: glutamate--cysteine ligase [Jiangellales bacterium]|nr:glutamate--cysteine ligase [Jiangellales bacterium]
MDLRSVGVEEELLVVDPADGTPSPLQDGAVEGAEDGVEQEFKREQAEIVSPPCDGLDDLHRELSRLRGELATLADRHGLAVAPLGTSPMPVRPTPTPDERYRVMHREYGMTAREQLSCGCHVHVSVASREEGVAVLDRIRPWLSVLIAVAANSPFWQQEDSGYASYRTMVWGRWPGAGPTEVFGDQQGYEDAVAALVRSEAILDTAMIYFDARLSARYPTVEVRVADVCHRVEDAVLLAALCRGLVDTAATEWRDGRPPAVVRTDLLRAADWRAARSGLGGELVDVLAARPRGAEEHLRALVDHVRPALERHGDEPLVEREVERLLRRGTGADRQRATLLETRRFEDVVLRSLVPTGTPPADPL